MIERQFDIFDVPKRELDTLESALKAHLDNIRYYKASGLRTDPGIPTHPYAVIMLEYGTKQFIRSPNTLVWIDARGSNMDEAFHLKLKVKLPEELYERITSALDEAPTIQTRIGQSYADK